MTQAIQRLRVLADFDAKKNLQDAKDAVSRLTKAFNAFKKANPNASTDTGIGGQKKDELMLAKRWLKRAMRGQA